MKKKYTKEQCKSCQALMINGIYCHEQGCPDAWKDTVRECKWCGTKFVPEEKNQEFCDESCAKDYWNIDD